MSEKITISIPTFREHVVRARGYTTNKGLVPAYGYLHFVKDMLLAFNGKAGYTGFLTDWSVDEPGFGLGAEHLASLAERLPAEGTLTVKVEDKDIYLSCKGFRAKIPILGETFPGHEKPPTKMTPFPKAVWEGVNKLYFSVGQDETKQTLRGVQASGGSKGGVLYATDSYRISRLPVSEAFDRSVLIPDTLLAPIHTHPEPPENYALVGSLLWLWFKGFIVHGPLLEGDFPEVEQIFQKMRPGRKGAVMIAFDAPAMTEALHRATLFSPDITFGVMLTCKPGSNSVVIRGEGTAGSAVETVRAKHNATEEVSFFVNGVFLSEAIQRCAVCRLSSPSDPLYFRLVKGRRRSSSTFFLG